VKVRDWQTAGMEDDAKRALNDKALWKTTGERGTPGHWLLDMIPGLPDWVI
jgi:hypothetical protein